MAAPTLTPAQSSELERLVTLKLPASWVALGLPGFPEHSLDMRSVKALQRRGLVECVIYRYSALTAITYRATETGRNLHASGTQT